MQNSITLKQTGYEPLIDAVKAYAIVAVLIGHMVRIDQLAYGLWIDMQVPLFVLVQVFHVLKRDNSTFDFVKIFKRIILPYLIIQTLLFVSLLIISTPPLDNFNALIKNVLICGGNGPGSYYPWVYVQLAIIIPLCRKLMSAYSDIKLAIIFIILCEVFEILSSVFSLSDYIHRLLAIRYLFLIYLGWIWVKHGIVLSKITILLSVLSMISILYFEYGPLDNEPWFFTTAWKTHRWPCYFYVSTLLTFVICSLYHTLSNNGIIDRCIKLLSKCSYEIFLMQMLILKVFPSLSFISDKYMRLGMRIFLMFVLSIVGGYYFNHVYNCFINKSKSNGLQ